MGELLCQNRLSFLCLPTLRLIANNFYKTLNNTGFVFQRHHLSAAPKTTSVFLLVPTFVCCTSIANGRLHLPMWDARLAIFLCKKNCRRLTEHLLFGPAHYFLGAFVPDHHQTIQIKPNYRIVGCAFEQHFQEAGAQ